MQREEERADNIKPLTPARVTRARRKGKEGEKKSKGAKRDGNSRRTRIVNEIKRQKKIYTEPGRKGAARKRTTYNQRPGRARREKGAREGQRRRDTARNIAHGNSAWRQRTWKQRNKENKEQ